MSGDDQLEQQAALQAYREAASLYKQQEFEKACEMLERLAQIYPHHETVHDALTMCETALAKKAALEFARRIRDEQDAEEDDHPPPFSDDFSTPLPDETPTPVPFDTPPKREESANDAELQQGLPLVAIVMGAVVGIAIGFIFSGPVESTLEGATLQPLALPTITAMRDDLVAAYPGPLSADIAQAVMEATQASPAITTGTAQAHTKPWSASPVWEHDGVRYWTSSWGSFFEYRPTQISDFAFWVVVLPPQTPANLSPSDSARACIEHESIQYFADRTGYPIVCPVIPSKDFPEYSRGEMSKELVTFINHIHDASVPSISTTPTAPIVLGLGTGGTAALHPDGIPASRIVACSPSSLPDKLRTDVPVTIVTGESDPRYTTYRAHLREIEPTSIQLDGVENSTTNLNALLPASLPHLVP